MAGTYIELDLRGLGTLQQIFDRLERLIQEPGPLLGDIGEYLMLSHDERFDRHEAPDGTPWGAVDDDYAKRKRAGRATKRSGAVTDPAQVLELTRDLRRLLRYSVVDDTLLFGSDREYAAKQQKDRPFIGLSRQDEQEIGRLTVDYLADAI